MRIKIICSLKEKEITLDYRRKILSCFKRCLENYNKEIKEYFYDRYTPKDLSFSCFFQWNKTSEEKIILNDNEFHIYLSFNSSVHGIHYYNALNKARRENIHFRIDKENSFEIINIINMKEKEIINNLAIFKTMSPIVIREKRENQSDWYHEMNDIGIGILKRNIKEMLKDKFSENELDDLTIKPINMKQSVIKFYNLQLTANHGLLAISGKKDILNYFYKSGIGSTKSSGFGLLELIQ